MNCDGWKRKLSKKLVKKWLHEYGFFCLDGEKIKCQIQYAVSSIPPSVHNNSKFQQIAKMWWIMQIQTQSLLRYMLTSFSLYHHVWCWRWLFCRLIWKSFIVFYIFSLCRIRIRSTLTTYLRSKFEEAYGI